MQSLIFLIGSKSFLTHRLLLRAFFMLFFTVKLCSAQNSLSSLTDTNLPDRSKNLFYLETASTRSYYAPFKKTAEEKLQAYLDFYQWDEVNIKPSPIKKHLSGISSPEMSIVFNRIENLWLDASSATDPYFKFLQNGDRLMREEFISIGQLLPKHTVGLNGCSQSCFVKKFDEVLWASKAYEAVIQLFDSDFDIKDDWGIKKTIPVNKYPNCFGTAKTIYTPGHDYQFENANSFQDYINENYTLILPEDQVNFGDLMTIYVKRSKHQEDKSLTLVHASTVISRDYVWGKPTSHPNDPWGFETITEAYHAQANQLRKLFKIGSHPSDNHDFFNRIRIIFWRHNSQSQ